MLTLNKSSKNFSKQKWRPGFPEHHFFNNLIYRAGSLLPLNGRRWLTRDVIQNAVHVLNFVDDPHGDGL